MSNLFLVQEMILNINVFLFEVYVNINLVRFSIQAASQKRNRGDYLIRLIFVNG
jgi:hypothetical protein